MSSGTAEPPVKYRFRPGDLLTRPRDPGRGPCQRVSLTGAVSSQTVTEES